MQTLCHSFDHTTGKLQGGLLHGESRQELLDVIGYAEFSENTERLLESYATGSTKCCGTGTC